MSQVTGKIIYSFKGKEVHQISDLPEEDYQELLLQLQTWRRKVSQEVIRQYLQTNASSVEVDIEWINPTNDKQ